ncbi:predicted protein, partial [Postia placenta Mad-698-R]
SLWFWLIQNHAQASGLMVIPVPFAKLTIVAVHGFFVINIWKQGTHLLGGYPGSTGILMWHRFSDDDATTTIANNLVSGVLGLAAAFAADVYITAALCFVLYGRRTGFQRLFQLAACISFGASVNTAVVPWALFIIPGNSGVPHLHDEEFGAANYSNHSLRQLADGYVRHPISHAMMPYSAQDISLNFRHHVADIVSNSQNNPRENMELHNVSAHSLPSVAPEVLFTVATPTVVGLQPGLNTTSDAALYAQTKIDLIDSLFADPDNVPFALKTSLIGQSVMQRAALGGVLLSRAQDPAKLFEAGKAGMPLLILHGTGDKIMSGDGAVKALTPHFSDMDVRMYEGAGHALFHDKQDEVITEILVFLKRIGEKTK